MVMIRSNRPSTLTAAKMFDVSLQSFCEVSVISFVILIWKLNILFDYHSRMFTGMQDINGVFEFYSNGYNIKCVIILNAIH